MKTTNALFNVGSETELNSFDHPQVEKPASTRGPVSHNNFTLIHNNSHNNSVPENDCNSLAINAQCADVTKSSSEKNSAPPSSQQYMDLMRKLLPPALRNRRFRVDSFMSQLTEEQRVLAMNWLQDRELSVLQVREKIAAPAPEGFGIKVNATTLYRLQNLIKNADLNERIARMMDATCDILDADTSVDPAPVREAISLLLHSDLLVQCRNQSDTVHIERLVNTITRLEKLKLLPRRNPRHESDAPATPIARHKVELSISAHIPRSDQTPPPEGSGAERPFHRYSIARDAESI